MGWRTRRTDRDEHRPAQAAAGYATPGQGVAVSGATIPFTPAAATGQPAGETMEEIPSRWQQVKDRSHRHRYALKPWMILSGLPTFTETLHLVPGQPLIKIAVPLLATAALVITQWKRRKIAHERAYAIVCAVYGGAWAAWATLAGLWHGFTLLALLVGWAPAAYLWWDRHMIRSATPAPAEEPEPDTEPFMADWDTKIAADRGPLPGSELSAPEDVLSGRAFRLRLPAGMTIEDAVRQQAKIAALLGISRKRLLFEAILNEHGDTDDESTIRVTLIHRQNPHHETREWTGPTLNLSTGLYEHAIYPDGAPAYARLFTVEGGKPWRACNSLFTGVVGAGKSRGVALKILEQQASGIFVTWFADGQEGVSVPEVRGQIDWYGDSRDETMRMLRAAYKEMRGRAAVQRDREWVDSRGNARVGMGHWEATREDPFIQVMIDEAQEILRDPTAAKLIKALLRQGNKVGIGVDLITQVPLLNELGGEAGDGGAQVIRSMAKAGNLFLGRAEDGMTAMTVVTGSVKVDPKNLPDVPGMIYLLGYEKRGTHSRTIYVSEDDLYTLLSLAEKTSLSALHAQFAGDDYMSRDQRRDERGTAGDGLNLAEDLDLDGDLEVLLNQRAPGQDAPGTTAAKLDTRSAVFAAVKDAGGPIKREDIFAAVRAMGVDVKDRQIADVLSWWCDRGHVIRRADIRGHYDLANRAEVTEATTEATAEAGSNVVQLNH